MSNFTDEFIKIFKVPQLDKYSTVIVGKEFEDNIAEVLGRKLSKSIIFVPEKKYEIGFKEFDVGDKWSLESLISLGYERVERVWN